MYRQVGIEGFGTGFNMEAMKIVRGKNDLKELIKHLIQSITKPKVFICGRESLVVSSHVQESPVRVSYIRDKTLLMVTNGLCSTIYLEGNFSLSRFSSSEVRH